MRGDDFSYWRRRAQEERERAMRSANGAVREAHRELAAAYEARLTTTGELAQRAEG